MRTRQSAAFSQPSVLPSSVGGGSSSSASQARLAERQSQTLVCSQEEKARVRSVSQPGSQGERIDDLLPLDNNNNNRSSYSSSNNKPQQSKSPTSHRLSQV